MTMKAGLYYIGDLCYVFNDNDWDEVCSLTIKGHECLSGEFEFKDGRRFAMYNTKYGDGLYQDQFGNKYGVDSGSIGCVLVDHISRQINTEEMEDLGAIVRMEHDFSTSGSRESGLIRISSTTIDTAGEWVEDEYDYDDDEEVV